MKEHTKESEDIKMANIYKGTLGLIGNTPLVEVINIEKELGLEATVLVKLEYFNPAGLKYSSLTSTVASSPSSFSILITSTSGVFPISPSVPL